MNRPYPFRLQPFHNGIARECVVVQPADAMVCADPKIPVPVFRKRANAEIAQAAFHTVIGEAPLLPAANALVGADPDTAVASLVDGADEIVDESVALGVLHAVRSLDTPQTVSVRPRPQDSRTVAKQIADADFPEWTREPVTSGRLPGKKIQSRAGNP